MSTLFPSRQEFCKKLESIFVDEQMDLYGQMNAMRDWVNTHYPTFDLYLEDTWNERHEGQTDLEYILRSRQTLNETEVLGYDAYKNHRDAKGVWHLGDYTHSIRLFDDFNRLYDFIEANQA